MENFVVFGRGELCIFTLNFLLEKSKNVIFVPDLPEPSWQDSVVKYCEENKIKIVLFDQIKNSVVENSIGISIYYRKIFKFELINSFKYFVNLHNGPLPKYRGVNPINWALKNNEEQHGVTLHLIDEGIDTGDILDQEIFSISSDLEVIEVYKLCIEAGKKIINRSILNLEKLKPIKQDHNKALYYSNKDFDKLGDRKNFRRNG